MSTFLECHEFPGDEHHFWSVAVITGWFACQSLNTISASGNSANYLHLRLGFSAICSWASILAQSSESLLNLLNQQIEYDVHEIVIWTPLRTFGGETNTLSHCPALNSPCGARKSIQVSHFWSVNLNFSTYRTVLKNLRGEQGREGYLWTFYSL